MSILNANLKLYIPFQKQPIGFNFAVFVNLFFVSLFLLPFFLNKKHIGLPFSSYLLIGFALFLFFFGQMAIMMQIDILAKPFSFCLPNHNKIPRQIIFLIGIGIAVIYSITLLQLPFDTESKRLMIITSPVIVLTFYFLPVCLTLYLQDDKPNQFVMLCFVILAVLLFVSLFKHTNYDYPAQELIPFCFVPFLISLIALVIAALKMLGEPDLKRKSHGKDSSMMVAFYTRPLNRDTLENVINAIRLSKKPKHENDELDTFLEKMKTKQYFSMRRSFWGYLYSSISYGFSYHNISPIKYLSTIIFLGSIVLIISGYQVYGVKRFLPDDVSLNMLQMIVLLSGCLIFDAIYRKYHHNQLLPVSRIQQFWLNFIFFLSKSLLVIFWFSIVTFISYGLQHIMPDIKLIGNYFTYHFIGTKLIILSLVIIPISSICSNLVKSFGLFLLIIMCSSGVGGALMAMIKLHVINFQITMIILAFILNTLFITLLIWHWFRRDNV